MSYENNKENDTGEIAALKNQVFVLLVALVVISSTLTIYLYRQAVLAGKDITQAQQLANVLNQNQLAVSAFISSLVAYGEKHPDFVPVLKKYGIAPIPGIPANASVGAVPQK